jgi:phage anti-repressor protein
MDNNKKELLPIELRSIGEGQMNTVNARLLYEFLGVRKDFSNWIKAQIKRARLQEDRDYILLTPEGEQTRGGNNRIDYFFTLESGKHIAMMSECDKGFEVRDYFIECEGIAQQKSQYNIPQTYPEALRVAADFAQENQEQRKVILNQNKELEEAKPAIEFTNIVGLTNKLLYLSDFAQLMSNNEGGIIGRTNIFRWLRHDKILRKNNIPYQSYVDRGWFDVRERDYENKGTNGPRVGLVTMITGKGQVALYKRFKRSKSRFMFMNKKAKGKKGMNAQVG